MASTRHHSLHDVLVADHSQYAVLGIGHWYHAILVFGEELRQILLEIIHFGRHHRRGHERETLSYLYVVNHDGKTLVGVVDLRELVLASDNATVGEIMTAPVVTAEVDDLKEDLAQLFAKYQYRMIPVADAQDRILGVIGYKDIMKGVVTRTRH